MSIIYNNLAITLKTGLLHLFSKEPFFNNINNSTTMKANMATNNNTEHCPQTNFQLDENKIKFAQVYLIFNKLRKLKNDGDILRFFERDLDTLDTHFQNQPVFLNKQLAMRYGPFLGHHYGVLRIYVPEIAIQGQFGELSLKPGFVNKTNIHGLYPGWLQGNHYYENPSFNQAFLSKA